MELLTESFDWTRPTCKNYPHKIYTYDEFIDQIKKQINKSVNKTKPKIWDEKYFLQEIKIILDEHIYNKIIERSNMYDQKLYPLVTFHSTQNMTKINSIIKYGYIVPRTKHPTFGWTNSMYYGNLYGNGIYSSPEFEKSQSYTFLDANYSIQILINFVILGRTKIVHACKWYPDDFVHTNGKQIQKKSIDLNYVIPSLHENVYIDLDNKEYDTLISPDQDIFVSANTNNIIPVGYLILSPNVKVENNSNLIKRYLSIDNNYGKTTKSLFDMDHYLMNLNLSSKSIDFVNIFDDYYIIDIANSKKKTNIVTNNYFIVPKISICSNKKLIEQFENFIDSIHTHILENKNQITKQNCILYTSYMEFYKKYNLNGKKKFSSVINEINNCACKISQDYENISELIIEIFNQIIKSEDYELNIIYLFVNNPTDINKLNQIISEYKIFSKVIIKIIFLNKLDNNKTKTIINIKNTFQNIDFFEQYFHEVNLLQNDSLLNTFDILLDECLNIPTISYTKLSIGHGMGIVGHGFVDTLYSQPNWDVNTINPYVLFKGYTNSLIIDNITYQVKYIKKDNDFFESLKTIRDKIIEDNEQIENKLLNQIGIDPRLHEQTISYSNNFVGIDKDILKLNIDLDQNKNCDVENLYCIEKKLKPELEFDSIKKETAWKKKLYRYNELKNKLKQGFIKNEHLEKYCEDYEDINKLYAIIIPLIAQFRNWTFKYPNRAKMQMFTVVKLLNELLERLDNFLNPDIIEFIRDVGYEQMSLSNRKTIKCELNKLIRDVLLYGKLSYESKWESKYLTKLLDIKYSNSIVKRLKKDFDINQLIQLIEPNKIYGKIHRNKSYDPIDLLEYFDIKGIGIRIKNSSSSEIDPWNIIIEYVGIDKKQMYQMVSANETGEKILDIKGKKINGLILDWVGVCIGVNNNVKTEKNLKIVHQIYYAHLFTSNPYLIIPNQEISLIVNSWVSSIEKIFKLIIKKNISSKKINGTIDYNLDNLKKLFEISIGLYRRMKILSHKNKEICEIYNCLLNKKKSSLNSKDVNDEFYEYLVSTKNNITSINKIIAGLSLFESNDTVIKDLETVLFSESIIRNARVQCKIFKKSKDQIILDFLGLNENTNLDTWSFDNKSLDSYVKITNKLFFKQYTNCSPFSVVGCFGFILSWNNFILDNNLNQNTCENQNSLLIDYMIEQFIGNKISMYNFLVENLQTTKTKLTQIALYLYGYKWSDLDKPCTVKFTNPIEIKSSITNEYVELIKHRQKYIMEKKLLTESKLLRKQLILMEKAFPFKKYHNTPPTIFGIGNIDELNIFREKNDQLELLPNGLLKYHCAYPDCPYYLKKFMTLTDIKTQGTNTYTRHGLMNHFKYDQINNSYIKNFHTISKCMAKNTSWEQFVIKMDNYYKNNINYNNFVGKK